MITVLSTTWKTVGGTTFISYNTSSSTWDDSTVAVEITVSHATTVDCIAIDPPAEEPKEEESQKVDVDKPCLDSTATVRKNDSAPGVEKMGVWPRWQRPPPASLFCLFQETSLRKESE